MKVTSDFSDLITHELGTWQPDRGYVEQGVDVPTHDEVHSCAVQALGDLRVRLAGIKAVGRQLVLPDERSGERVLLRRKLYVLAEPTRDAVLAAVSEVAVELHRQWGAGDLWTLGKIGYLRRSDSHPEHVETRSVYSEDVWPDVPIPTGVHRPECGRRVVLGVYYFHSAMPDVGAS